MSVLRSLTLAIDLATGKRDQAQRVLTQLNQAHLFAQNQMSQLEVYAAETDAKWTSAAQISATPELMRHHYQFMGRLYQAIELQKSVLENSNFKMSSARQQLLEADFRLASLKLVLQKKTSDLSQLQSRREQKQMDEFAAMQTRRAAGGFYTGDQS